MKLYEHQIKVLEDARGKPKYGLFLEPGLGKTYTSLAIAKDRGFKKVLIVCQPSKSLEWQRDVKTILNRDSYILSTPKKDKVALPKNDILISSYGLAWRRELLKYIDQDWIVIIDESQYLKSRSSAIGKWGMSLPKYTDNILLLSGTPINHYEEWFNQINMLGLKITWKNFFDTFVVWKEVKFMGCKWPTKMIIGYSNIDKLLKFIKTRATFLKVEDCLTLPKQNFEDIPLNFDKPSVYNYVKKEYVYKDLAIPNSGVLYMRLRQLGSGFIEEYKNISNHKKNALKELLDSNKKDFVVFYNYKQELEDIKEICANLKIKVFQLNGQVKNYSKAINCKERFIIAAQYQSGAEGHNLQFLNYQIYYSPPSSFMKYQQSLARIYRIGQTKPVFYYRFITIGTVEERIYKNLAIGKSFTEKMFKEEN